MDRAGHRVATHRLARARVAGGKPSWASAIPVRDLVHKDRSGTDPERASAAGREIAALLLSRVPAGFLDPEHDDHDEDLANAVDEMKDMAPEHYASTPDLGPREALTACLDAVYDWADANRVWLG